MSENQNCGINDFSKYDEMTTEELEEILRLDADNTEDQESDTEALLYIMGVLTKRRKNNGHTGNTAQEAYEVFKQHYMPETDHNNPVPEKAAKPKNQTFPWMRGLVAAAAVIAILILGSVTAKAFGVDVWKAVFQWTQETFHFGEWGNTDTDNNLPYASLQEALEKGKVTTPLVPTQIPDGYTLVEITVTQNPLKRVYRAKYTNGDQVLRITIQDFLDKFPVYVEQSEGLVEEYVVSGITYYLFDNNERTQAVWMIDSFECRITGELTIDELKLMIDSIEKG